jgi:hypothetical protein
MGTASRAARVMDPSPLPEQTPPTWETRALPLLHAIAALETTSQDEQIEVSVLARMTGISDREAYVELKRLLDAGYLRAQVLDVMGDDVGETGLWDVMQLEKGSRAVGQWPSGDPYEALLALIERRMAEETDPEARGRLDRLRGTLIEVGKGTASGVLAALVRSAAGL